MLWKSVGNSQQSKTVDHSELECSHKLELELFHKIIKKVFVSIKKVLFYDFTWVTRFITIHLLADLHRVNTYFFTSLEND